MPETLDFPTVDEAMIANAAHTAADLAVVKPTPPDLTKIDLTDVALAMYGKWPDEVKAVKANLSTLALDLSTPSKITEARSLRTRLILNPLAAARKVSAGIKSKMATTSKAVGAELEKIEAAYKEADALILPKIEAREAELEAERLKKAKAEQERKEAHEAKIAGIRACITRAETEEGMTAERVAKGIAQLQALPTPTKEVWEEYAVPAASAICETLDRMRIIHARLLRAEQAEAEAAELRAKLAAQAPAAVIGVDPASPTGDMGVRVEGVRNEDGTTTITKIEFTEGRASQQVLKAEPATADATDRDVPAMSSPSVGSMGSGQAADAAPAGGETQPIAAHEFPTDNTLTHRSNSLDMPAIAAALAERAAPGPITMIEPASSADPRDVLLREALALTKYAAAPFFGKFPTHPKTTPEWWAGLREQIEALQPKLIAHVEGQA